MSDIFEADNAKWTVRFFLWELQRQLSKFAKGKGMLKGIMEIVHDDLRTSPNIGIKKIYKWTVEAASHMKEHYQTATILDILPFGLWVGYHDTAYRDPGFWLLDRILQDAEQLRKDIAPFVKDPKDWYCPTWHNTKKNTGELREKGLITPFQIAPDEQEFVPEVMLGRMNKELNLQQKMKEQLRLRDRETK